MRRKSDHGVGACEANENSQPVVIRTTRVALYERVWVTPVRDLAREFGMFSGGFVALCGREEIPLPVRGYWNYGRQRRKALKIPLHEPEIDWKIEVRVPPEKMAKRRSWRSSSNGIVVPRRL
ncbi:MAG: hypothetical protein WCS01_15330, partial [bacterium]